MIIVTGGAGMIGSTLIKALNKIGIDDILLVDDLSNGRKCLNINDLSIKDYCDKNDFLKKINNKFYFDKVDCLFHQGACSSTTEWNGKYVMENNFEYSKLLLNWCQINKVKFISASSASVYGNGEFGFLEQRSCEKPINMYAFSKFQFDQYLRSVFSKIESQVVSLRYFNVYGPRESHKGDMASTIYHFNNQILTDNECRLFKGIDGFSDGEQKRDFVYVGDCAEVNIWFMNNSDKSGIFNVGTGRAESFNEVAKSIIDWQKKNRKDLKEELKIRYIPFPKHLIGAYQNYTKADITSLRKAGYKKDFLTVREGVHEYLNVLNSAII